MKKLISRGLLAVIFTVGLCNFAQAERKVEIEIVDHANSKKAALRLAEEFIDMGCWLTSIVIEDPFWLDKGKKGYIYKVKCLKKE